MKALFLLLSIFLFVNSSYAISAKSNIRLGDIGDIINFEPPGCEAQWSDKDCQDQWNYCQELRVAEADCFAINPSNPLCLDYETQIHVCWETYFCYCSQPPTPTAGG